MSTTIRNSRLAPLLSSSRRISRGPATRRNLNPLCRKISLVSVLIIWTIILAYIRLMNNGSIKINQASLEKGAKVLTGLRHQQDRVERQMKTAKPFLKYADPFTAVDSAFEAAQRAFHLQQQQQQQETRKEVVEANNAKDANSANAESVVVRPPQRRYDEKERKGFVVLGMHRSGTSMLSGLLVQGMGYNVGAPLIQPAFDNEKGFFELLPIVLQNDEFLAKQHMGWSYNLINYDYKKALEHKRLGIVKFKEGGRGLPFLNNPNNAPWLQKDPRMCITLKTWLELLNSEPAVVFTYRHPLEVALSLHHREGFDLLHGLRLWIVYNMRAIQNSQNLCKVYSSNEKMLANPRAEVERISYELTHKCNVPPPPRKLSQEDVDVFVDPKLQHEKKKKKNVHGILEQHGDCVVPKYDSSHEQGSAEQVQEEKFYRKAMKIFCDLNSGTAYSEDYEWPSLD